MEYEIKIHYDYNNSLKDLWNNFEKKSFNHCFQNFYWLENWYKNLKDKEALIICTLLVTKNNQLSYIFPFCLEKKFGIWLLKWQGGLQADYMNGLFFSTTDIGKIQLTLQRARDKILQPPVLIAVTSKLDSEDSFREEEDYAATVCSLHNMILSLWDQDIGSQWSTGSITRDPNTYSALSIAMDEERIIGFVKVGYPEVIPSKEKKPISEIRFYLP